MTHIHTSYDKGLRKEKTLGPFLSGFFIMIDMPSFIKGLEKSMTLSLLAVMVRGAMARSASFGGK